MDSNIALSILLQNITKHEELFKPENKWILHSIYVGLAAGRIARELKIDEDYATAIGYLHDIGRMISHNNHPIAGYIYLTKLGYPDVARYSITHSFINNVIPNTIGSGPDGESYDFISKYLNSITLNIYDNIIQLCDLFCLETGFTTFEKRILDITKRKGVYENSQMHFKSIMNLRNKMEVLLGTSIYSLFPEIKKKDLDSIEEDREILLEMFKNTKRK